MSDSPEETVLVRDRQVLRQLPAADEWTVLTLLGALSADPRTLDELARAWLRYRPEGTFDELPWTDWRGDAVAGPWVLLDLACRRVLVGGGAELPENPDAFQRDEGPWTPQMPVVWINVPPDWQYLAAADWEQALPPLPVAAEPLDARGVLFGRAAAEGIARRTLEIARDETLPAELLTWDDLRESDAPAELQRAAAKRWHALTVRVHADWLMTPREDLDGQPPRNFLHLGRDWVDRELDNRQRQWMNEGPCPRPLDRDTFAYRYGPLGRHEVVMYFDFCRELIGAAWKRILAAPAIEEQALTGALYEHAEWWLASGSIDDDPTPPAVIIEKERRRIPLTGDSGHLDCDCPLCRMAAEGGAGLMFMGFDGHQLDLDDEFAFSLCATREEWEQQQEEYREFSARLDAEREQRSATGDDPFSSVWTNSYVDDEAIAAAGASSALSLMALATRLAELIGDLKAAGGCRELIESLNAAFDGYRAAESDPALAAAAGTEIVAALERIAAAQPHLTPKAADLQSQLAERQRNTDLDVPF